MEKPADMEDEYDEKKSPVLTLDGMSLGNVTEQRDLISTRLHTYLHVHG